VHDRGSAVSLHRYQQAELQNGRWAMLGTAGVLFPEILSNLGTGGPAAQQVCTATLRLHAIVAACVAVSR
jgi:Chlorophyll A-B binding protein